MAPLFATDPHPPVVSTPPAPSRNYPPTPPMPRRRSGPLSSPRWQRFRRDLIASTPHPVCHLCGRGVDPALRYPHPLSIQVDHVVPLALGGEVYDPANCRLSHKRCNERRGAMPHTVPPPSREW